MFDQALSDAAELDEFLRVNGRPKGPLHGLPISVKEHIFLTGTPATSGFVAWAEDISKSDALIIKILREAGAVFHVKTTNPQGLMVCSTQFHISPPTYLAGDRHSKL
jgi:amidase